MANGQQLSLEILIKTIADSRGIATTNREIEQLADSMRSAAAAGKPLETNADAIADSLQRTKQTTKETTDEFKGFTEEQKRQAQALADSLIAQDRAAKSSATLGRDVRSATTAFGGLRNIIGGALHGNLLQVAQGLGQISNAAANATKGMQLFFGQLARGGAIGAVVAGPILIGIQALNAAAKEAEATMQRWWDNAAKSAEAYRHRSAEVTAAAAQDLEKLRAEIARTAADYDALLSRMDASARRADELRAAQKELELAQAKTPEERAAIEARHAATGLVNDSTRADLQIRNAQEAEAQARQNIRDAEARVRDAEAAFSASPSREGRDAINAAKANLDQVQRDASPVFQRAQEAIDAARHTQQLAGIRSQTLSATTARGTAESLAGSGDRATELRRTAQSAMERGDYATQDRAVAELRKLDAAAKGLSRAVVEAGATSTAALEAAAKELKKQQERVKNTAESKAGS